MAINFVPNGMMIVVSDVLLEAIWVQMEYVNKSILTARLLTKRQVNVHNAIMDISLQGKNVLFQMGLFRM